MKSNMSLFGGAMQVNPRPEGQIVEDMLEQIKAEQLIKIDSDLGLPVVPLPMKPPQHPQDNNAKDNLYNEICKTLEAEKLKAESEAKQPDIGDINLTELTKIVQDINRLEAIAQLNRQNNEDPVIQQFDLSAMCGPNSDTGHDTVNEKQDCGWFDTLCKRMQDVCDKIMECVGLDVENEHSNEYTRS